MYISDKHTSVATVAYSRMCAISGPPGRWVGPARPGTWLCCLHPSRRADCPVWGSHGPQSDPTTGSVFSVLHDHGQPDMCLGGQLQG